jgi:hypothetical protein
MKPNPKYKKVYLNMQNGEISKEGFLGNDKRELNEIIEDDEKLIQSLNINIDEIVDKMEELKTASIKGLGDPVIVDNKWQVKIDEVKGYLACPFEDGIYRKHNINIKNLNTNKEINFSDMSLHLIKKHHFFQGKGSFYRLEPKQLKEILEL